MAAFLYRQANPIPVMEHFYTLQGEGAYTGYAAYFVRLAGCDVGCHWCDVKDSWTFDESQMWDIEKITDEAANSGASLAVITGGEPAIYDLSLLTNALHAKGLRTHIETSGAHILTGDWDWVCLSPKKFLPPKKENYSLTHELKIIIFNESDFAWAEEHASLCPPTTRLFLQAEWSKKDKMYPKIIDYIKQNPKWQMSTQVHKYLDIP